MAFFLRFGTDLNSEAQNYLLTLYDMGFFKQSVMGA